MGNRRVFISYAREDEVHAKRLFRDFKSMLGVEPWLDLECLLPGQDWKEHIFSAIEKSDYIAVLLSKKSSEKEGFVQREFRETLDRALYMPPGRLFIIPIKVEPCEVVHVALKSIQYVSLFPEWSTGIKKIAAAIGVKHYTHQVYFDTRTRRHEMVDLTKEDRIFPYGVFVNLDNVPTVLETDIPDEGIKRDNAQLVIFLNLWSEASISKRPLFYAKNDWLDLDHLLFTKRTSYEKRQISYLFRMLWGLAKETEPFLEEDWRTLARLISPKPRSPLS